MKVKHSELAKYLKSIEEKYRDESLYSPILLNSETLVFPFQHVEKKLLVISLNKRFPLVYATNSKFFFSSFESPFLLKLKKEVGNSQLKAIYLNESDFCLTIEIDPEDLDKEHFFLEIKLIPFKGNIRLLDSKKNEVVSMFKYDNEPIEFFDGEEEINDKIIEEHFINEIDIRKKEKYGDFIKSIKGKIKSINRKIDNIEADKAKAEVNLKCNETADAIFTLGLNLKGHYKEIDVYGDLVKLDETKTLLENTQLLYKSSKKAKETINRNLENLTNAKLELERYEAILSRIDVSNEKEMDKLVNELTSHHKKRETKETEFNKPYKLNLNGTIFYFGRNASQNDYLSFVMKLNRDFTWVHIKDKSGSHIIICNPKPTENELIYAAEVALICSHTTSGEVIYTRKKNIRRGSTLGEAKIKNYSVIKLNSIREESKIHFATATRVN